MSTNLCSSIFLDSGIDTRECVGFCSGDSQICSCLLGFQDGNFCDENFFKNNPQAIPFVAFNAIFALIPLPFCLVTLIYRVKVREFQWNLSNIGLATLALYFAVTFFHQIFLAAGGPLEVFYFFYFLLGESIRYAAIASVTIFWGVLAKKLEKLSSTPVKQTTNFIFIAVFFVQLPIRALYLLSALGIVKDLLALFMNFYIFILLELSFSFLLVLFNWRVFWVMKKNAKRISTIWKMLVLSSSTIAVQLVSSILGIVAYAVLTQDFVNSKPFLQATLITLQIALCWILVFVLRGGSIRQIFRLKSWQYTDHDQTSSMTTEDSVTEDIDLPSMESSSEEEEE